MKRFIICVVAVLVLVSLIGCAQKQIAAPPEQPAAKPSEAMPSKAEPVTEKQKSMVAQEEMKAAEKEMAAKVSDVYFAFDKYDLDDAAKATLKGLASMMGKMNAKVVIEGNCDDRGTKEYNLALGDRRANAAKQYLGTLGIPSAKIESISYGKEKPICTESTEECWTKNRRDHFVLVEGGR